MQKDIRSYILNRVRSPMTTVEKFNWDNLRAPFISELFSPYDLQELHYLATSVKMSSKTKEKIQRIDKIMMSRGFTRFISGTNRLTYRFIEDTSFIAKVAFNNIGIKDAPMEYQIQHVYKPFVPKVFEYTPDGVLSIQERVEPITNREEFMSVAEDVYTLITEFLLGEYVFDDIGSNYFMNYGIRKGFGVVILDFPYMFKVDYGKLICAAKDPTTISGTCEGEIDYDDGFNELHCTKCGAIYTAKDLGKRMEEEKVMIRPTQGGLEMFGQFINLNLSGGSKNLNKQEVIGENPFVGFIPNKPIVSTGVSSSFTPFNLNRSKTEDADENIQQAAYGVNGVVVEDRPEAVHDLEETKEEYETDLGEPDATEDIEFTDDEPKNKEVKLDNPLTIHDNDEEFKAKAKEESIEEALEKTSEAFSEKDKVTKVKDLIDSMNKEELVEIIKHIFTKITIESATENTDVNMKTSENEEEGEGLSIIIKPEIQLKETEESIDIASDDMELSVFIPTYVLVHLVNSSDMVQLDGEEDCYKGFLEYAAETINKKDLGLENAEGKVIALKANNGNYLTDKFGSIICISKIDNKYINHLSVIPNSKLNNAINDTKNVSELKPGATAQ